MLKRRNSIPGFQEGGMNVDPVSGNEVPVGSLPEEVRDDVDAKLSPGEFVIPADVVRFIGLERLMKMRDEAKKGIQRMSDIGQMGNAEEVGEESNSTYEDDGFESEIDDILGEVENENNGGDVDDQMKMAFGGYVGSGTDLSKAPKNPAFDVRYYKNKEGATMFITHINGKPMTPIPEGFTAVSSEEAMKVGSAADEEKKKAATGSAADQGGYDASQLDPAVAKFLENETPAERDARMGRVSKNIERITGALPFVGAAKKAFEFFKGPQRTDEEAARIPEETRTPGLPFNEQQSIVSTVYSAVQNAGVVNDEIARKAASRVLSDVNSGVDINTATNKAVVEAQARQDMIDRGGGGTESSVGTPESTPDPFSASFDGPAGPFGAAKGGLVAKRQYPTKKKKGKGIAASK
jgi:Arc/MetJ-type ribon-helix-helix transcriptional regulator